MRTSACPPTGASAARAISSSGEARSLASTSESRRGSTSTTTRRRVPAIRPANAEDGDPGIAKFDESSVPPAGDRRTATSRILIVDDHELLGESLALALRLEGLEATVVSGPGRADVIGLAFHWRPDVILLDHHLGGDLGVGSTLVGPLAETGARVIMVSGTMQRGDLATCLEQGAEGFVDKQQAFDALLGAVLRAVRGELLMTPEERTDLLVELQRHRADREARERPFRQLTVREAEVLAALVRGQAAEQIAAGAVVSTTTVRSQIRSILLKLGVNSQLRAVAMARESGWQPPA